MRRVRTLVVVLLALALPLQGTALAAQACACPAGSAVAAEQMAMTNCDTPPGALHSTGQHHAPDCANGSCACPGAMSAAATLPSALRTWAIGAREPVMLANSRPFSFDPCPGPWRPPRAC